MSRRAHLSVIAVVMLVGRQLTAASPETEIAIVSSQGCRPELRERIAQQIAGIADPVVWSCLSRLDQEEPFKPVAAGPALRFWIDLTPATEARLTLRDRRSDRFVVRRMPLPTGLDEIGREEIGQIVRSALLAAEAGPDETLTRADARAEIARWPQLSAPPAAPPPARETPPQPPFPFIHIDFEEAFGALRAFAPQIPVVGEVGVAGAIRRPGPFGVRLHASYQLPARYDATPVGVALSAFVFRAALFASRRLGRTVDGRLGAGGGLTRMSFTPQSEGTAATAGPAGAFWYATGNIFAGADFRLGAHVVARLTAFLDVLAADVHYDLRQPDGTPRRVLVPHRFQPGLALGITWR